MVTRKHTKKYRKSRRKVEKRQKGGQVLYFHVYVFTKVPLSSKEKESIQGILEGLYGKVGPLEDYSDTIGLSEIYTSDMIEFVHKKGKQYRDLKEVTGFHIYDLPAGLKEGNMNDPKLTAEEYKIQDSLKEKGLPFRLIEAPHGLWGDGIALIGLERGS
jgi:hypothetical protein